MLFQLSPNGEMLPSADQELSKDAEEAEKKEKKPYEDRVELIEEIVFRQEAGEESSLDPHCRGEW